MSKLPEWARDPDAVLEKRAKAEERSSFWRGLAFLGCVVLVIVAEVLDAVAWLGGMKTMGWIE
jgi:hypothetical protein